MKMKRKLLVALSIFAFVLMGFVASRSPERNFKNLKVLPKEISKQELDKVMDEFKAALGVKCNFCHVHQKDNPREWDFVSDEKPEKTVARKMMTMTNKINKKFFHGKATYGETNAMLEVRCITCHHGEPHPQGGEEMKEAPKQ
jgi:photosynthetic reaction center cytochrome c subunit